MISWGSLTILRDIPYVNAVWRSLTPCFEIPKRIRDIPNAKFGASEWKAFQCVTVLTFVNVRLPTFKKRLIPAEVLAAVLYAFTILFTAECRTPFPLFHPHTTHTRSRFCKADCFF